MAEGKITVLQNAEHKHEQADPQHRPCQHLAQLCELSLKRRLLILRLCKRIGDLTHFSVHTRCGDHSLPAPVNHRASHIDHILSVAQRNVLGIPQTKHIHKFIDRNALAGKRRFFDLQAGTL